MSVPLLATKLNIPPPRPTVVHRSRLITYLEEGLDQHHRLTLVSARAGAGKTTLVSEWLHQQELPAAWVSLDRNDNDPPRFFRYLVAALQQIGIDVNPAVLHQFEATQPIQTEGFLSAIINDMESGPSSFVLVLDDYHLIENAWIDEAISFLIEHQPPQLHLVIITRSDPLFSLSRLRGRGQITEIRDTHLHFDTAEAAQFLNQVAALDLSAEAIAMLEARTEGWITGLQLAAISLQTRQQKGEQIAFAETFGGTTRFILDYLLDEVLDQQEPVVRDFLIETSILERMCPDLCDDLLHDQPVSSDSRAILTYLEQANLFVIPLDDEKYWYRYHHLFADLLGSMLRAQRSPDAIRSLHERASQWYQAQGYLDEAMTHAIAAEDYERAAAMIDENIVTMFSRSEMPTLLSWLKQLPEAFVEEQPWFDVYRAYTAVLSGELEGVDALLAKSESRIDPAMSRASELAGHVAAVRAYAANLRGDGAQVRLMAAQTNTYLSEGYLTARGMAAYALADTCLSDDDIDGAQDALQEMLRIGEQIDRSLMVVTPLCDMATVEKIRGRLHQAEGYYQQAYQWMIEHHSIETRVRCAYEFGLADLLCEWNDLSSADEHVMVGMDYRSRLGGYLVGGDLVLMRVLQAQGNGAGALDALHQAEQFMQTYHFQMTTGVVFRTSRMVQSLAVGDLEAAAHYARDLTGGAELEQIALARLRLAQGQPGDALRLLEDQRALAEAGGRVGRMIEIICWQGLALDALGRPDEAEEMIMQALLLGRAEGYARVFLDAGSRMIDLLGRLAGREASSERPIEQIVHQYIRDLLAQADAQAGRPEFGEFDPLTEREIEVLQLLADGLSNKDMAEMLIVAPSTIKQHLKNIYSKLQVHNRTQAVARGRELNLL